jgi:hypothetical protein
VKETEALALESRGEPLTPTEEYMARLWVEIIGLEKLDRTDKFLEVGGNSLTLNVVLNRIKQERGVSITPQLFFDPDQSSVASLARELDELIANPNRPR